MLDLYYKDTEEAINYVHFRTENPPAADFHLHNRFEIYFFISGNVTYFIEKKVYHLKYGDLLVMNSHEIHKPSFQPGEAYERIVIHFDPSIPRLFNPPGFDLLHCFVNRPIGEQNKINLSKSQIDEVLKMFQRVEKLDKNPHSSSGILKLTYFIELLIFINQVFIENTRYAEEHPSVPEKLAPILDFIDSNLESDLSLKVLEHKFFIDKSYLSRLFKKSTGSNIHEYIIYKRISKAKKLLSEGFSVTDTCMNCGFNDYSNFLRMFKRTVGVSPGEYKKSFL